MSTTETRNQNIPSMLNRHEAEIEAMIAELRARHEQERKDVERQLAEMDREHTAALVDMVLKAAFESHNGKLSPRSQMNVSLVGIHTAVLPEAIHTAINHARAHAAPDTTPIAVYAIAGPRDGDRIYRIGRTVMVVDISDILPPER